MAERTKVLWLSDHPLVPSGVGWQAKISIIELLKTGRYKFHCFGGAIKHPNYDLQSVDPQQFGDGNWMIQPVDGHGNKDLLRRALAQYKPDVIVLFTDPRFFTWVWEMEDEVRSVCPIVYWHVWDNDPIPEFNRPIYEATDFVMPLSLKTYGILQGLGYPQDRFRYVPHAEPDELFKPLPDEQIEEGRRRHFGPFADREFVIFWNNRNARRKMTGDILESVNHLAKRVGRDKVGLLMHTQANDPEGQDINAIVRKLKMEDLVGLSEQRVPPEHLNLLYNCCDCTINLSNNEGFGLGTLESLFAGTPIVVNMTGGLQFQIGDWWQGIDDFSDQEKLTKISKSRKGTHRWWGEPVYPVARNNVGSQQVPYIYDDRVSSLDASKALEKVMKLGRKRRRELGREAREWAREEFSIARLAKNWDECLSQTIAKHRESRGKMKGVRLAAI